MVDAAFSLVRKERYYEYFTIFISQNNEKCRLTVPRTLDNPVIYFPPYLLDGSHSESELPGLIRCQFMTTVTVIGGSRDVSLPPPPGSKFFHFHEVSAKNLKKKNAFQ